MRYVSSKVVLVVAAIAAGVILSAAQAPAEKPLAAITPETVTFQNGAITLHGFLYKPEGTGPFPAVLYNHGSARGITASIFSRSSRLPTFLPDRQGGSRHAAS